HASWAHGKPTGSDGRGRIPGVGCISIHHRREYSGGRRIYREVMGARMRVGIISIQHESNTFLSTPTALQAFAQDRLYCGESIRAAVGPAEHEVGGFFAGLASENIDAVPLLMAA